MKKMERVEELTNNKQYKNKKFSQFPHITNTSYESIDVLTETGDSIYNPEHESNKLEFGPRRGKLFISLDKL